MMWSSSADREKLVDRLALATVGALAVLLVAIVVGTALHYG